jgi:hypothetical protein
MHQQIADDREQERDQRAGDGNAGVHHPLEDFINYVLLGDVAGQRIADALDVVLDRGEFGRGGSVCLNRFGGVLKRLV